MTEGGSAGGGIRGRVREVAARPSTSLALESAGALTLADRLDRIRCHGDIVPITLPVGAGQLRAHRIKMHLHDGRDQAVRAMVTGGWRGFEPPLPDVLVRTARAFDGHVYDVGANSGLYALLAAEARSGVRVYAFEPFPPVLEVLRGNIALNRSHRRVEVIAAAAADEDGEMTLYVPPDSGALETSSSLDGSFKETIAEEIAVRTLTLDRFWREQGSPAVSLVKIDTEGTEHRVLAGCRDLVRQARPVLFFEVLPRAALDELRAFGDDLDLVDVCLAPSTATIGRPVDYDPDGWNHAFVPRDRLARFEAVLVDCGLVVEHA